MRISKEQKSINDFIRKEMKACGITWSASYTNGYTKGGYRLKLYAVRNAPKGRVPKIAIEGCSVIVSKTPSSLRDVASITFKIVGAGAPLIKTTIKADPFKARLKEIESKGFINLAIPDQVYSSILDLSYIGYGEYGEFNALYSRCASKMLGIDTQDFSDKYKVSVSKKSVKVLTISLRKES